MPRRSSPVMTMRAADTPHGARRRRRWGLTRPSRYALVSIRSPEDTVRFIDRPYRQARYGLLFAAVNLVVFVVTYPTWSMLRDRQREQAFTEFNRGLGSDPPAVPVPDIVGDVDDAGCNPDFNDCPAPPRAPHER